MIKRKITQRLEQMRVFNDGTLEDEGDIRYVPIYMSMFLEKGTLPEKLIYDIGATV